MERKECSKCGEEKELKFFHKSIKEKDGYKRQCKECRRVESKKYYDKNSEIIKEKARKWVEKNPERRKQTDRLYYKSNEEEILAYQKEYYSENKEYVNSRGKRYYQENREYLLSKCSEWASGNVEKVREYKKKYRKNNKAKVNSLTRKRQASKLNRTPKWLTEIHNREIEEFYEKAQKLSSPEEKYCVDHIVPLQGKTVSGLHVPWNLQVIPMKENSIKSNKLEF